MAYLCKDCSYRGKTSGQVGECPACGSFNMVRRPTDQQAAATPAPKWRIALMLLLWSCLIALVGAKLIQ